MLCRESLALPSAGGAASTGRVFRHARRDMSTGTANTQARIEIERARWDDLRQREEMSAIRMEVFVAEQQVPADEEIDGRDPACRHVLARDEHGGAIGTARMQQSGHIGRIAVVRAWRRRAVGSRLVAALLDLAREQGLESVDLGAQLQAIGFYERLGFAARGEIFMDAGIPHRNMVLSLSRLQR
jgi:predicted GNAT family N-acyltransferase